MESPNYKCHFCNECLGTGCINELPGMGGINNNENFQLNCQDWKKYHPNREDFLPFHEIQQRLRLAPITGARENIGFYSEEKFYFDFLKSAYDASLHLSIGDGFPREKLLYGINALQQLSDLYKKTIKAAVFLKPWTNSQIFEEIELCSPIAEYIGIDIDSVDIVTMKHCASLEKKTASQLTAIHKKLDVPFVLKGIFSEEDVALVKEVKPDIVVISNHGGRVSRAKGSTADFLYHYGKILSNHCQTLFVDGGIRTQQDIQAAIQLGAQEVLLGRTCISAFCKDTEKGIARFIQSLKDTQSK